jgi:sigma-B regulation protein RsbU (phosphoserine phosphatase)
MATSHSAATLLVVDDEPNVRKALKRLLARDGYQIILAEDGISGLYEIQNNEIDLIIADAMMPGMDGITFLSKVNDIRPDTAQILLTGSSDIPLLSGAINSCQLNKFLTKPWDSEELLLTIETVLQENNLARQSESSHQELMRELDQAAAMQVQQLKEFKGNQNFQFDWLYQPCTVLAGDGIGLRQEQQKTIFYLLDVAGHGPAAAMGSFALQQILANLPLTDPEETALGLNRMITSRNKTMNYFTMIYGDLDNESGKVRFCQAGHPHPIHWSCQTGQISMPGEGGFPIGLVDQATYSRIELQLESGDRLFFCSDGLVDMGLNSIINIIESNSAENLEVLKNKIQKARMEMPVDDDISLLALEWKS